ncbi:MAG: DUF2079 domain-containing protein, partial [Chloroflexi bacterium]|nr:DUF2079 domain-containing protein [Chloroflexota bacterium]
LLLRLANGFVVYTPIILLGRRAPGWLLVAGSIIFPVFVSTGPGPSFNYIFHHYALSVPFLIAAAIYGAEHAKKKDASGRNWVTAVRFTFFITLIINLAAVNTPLNPAFYLGQFGSGQGMETATYGITSRDQFKDAWLAEIPAEAAVSADRLSALRLIDRDMLTMNQPLHKSLNDLLPALDYVIVDALFDFVRGTPEQITADGVATEHATIEFMLQQPDWHITKQDDGLLRFQKEEGLLNDVVTLTEPSQTGSNIATFADTITLLDATIQHVAPNRLRFQFIWQAKESITDAGSLMAVTQLKGVEHTRIVHIPTLAIAPTETWQPGDVVQETFEWQLPEGVSAETAVFQVGWYEIDNLYASFTDERSRIGELVEIKGLSE